MNYYEILKVSATATDEVIRKNYKKLAMKYHPDKNKEPSAAKKFKKISNAYSVLSDKDKRRKYDRILKKEKREKNIDNNSRFNPNREFEDLNMDSAMRMFNDFLKNIQSMNNGFFGEKSPFDDPFFKQGLSSNPFDTPFFRQNMYTNGNSTTSTSTSSSSYSTTVTQTVGRDGKVKTVRSVNINDNGKQYSKKSYVDEDGKEHTVKHNVKHNVKQDGYRNKKTLKNR